MTNFEFDNEKPLALCEGESVKSNALLQKYYKLGAKRSLEKLCQLSDVTTSLRQVARYSSDYEWVQRVRAAHSIDGDLIRSELVELRTEILQRFGEVVMDSLNDAIIEDASLSQLSGSVKAFFDAFAMQYDAMPTRRVETLNLNDLTFENVLQQLENEKVG
jgi:hypothetical protein